MNKYFYYIITTQFTVCVDILVNTVNCYYHVVIAGY